VDLQLTFSYESCVAASEKVAWKLDEVFPEGTSLDFSRPFLPEGLAPTKSLTFLSDDERRILNQITGNAYLNLFAFVEEYILTTMVQHAQAEMFGNHVIIRALVRFADEEIKHQQLFYRYRRSFNRDFGSPCDVLDNAAAVAGVILSKSPIAVMLVTLHIEWMTQQHYTEGVKDDGGVDPLFARLLKQHWLEEAQHARIDALELQKLVRYAKPEVVAKAFGDYRDLLDAFAGLLEEQSKMDIVSFEKKLAKTFSDDERAAIGASQKKGYVQTFLVHGMTNPTFVEIATRLDAAEMLTVSEKAKGWS
jgi:hypothetical protein